MSSEWRLVPVNTHLNDYYIDGKCLLPVPDTYLTQAAFLDSWYNA